MSASLSLGAILHIIWLASLSDLFGSLRKPTERAKVSPYNRTFAKKNPPPDLESQDFQLDPTFLSPRLFFCLVLSLFLSYPVLLSAHSPDLSFPKPPPPKGGRGISDVSPLSGISRLPVRWHFSVSPLLFFSLVLSLFLTYPLLLLAHSPNLFFPKLPCSER